MTKIRTAFIVTFGLATATIVSYGYVSRSTTSATLLNVASQASAAERAILYYRDPTGAPAWSATPKADAQGRAYLPVYDDAEPGFDPPRPTFAPLTPLKVASGSGRKILFYRNPMGLPDTSPVPKKDSMGMNYIAVYDGDEQPGGTIKLSLDRIQRSGVRTETVQARALVRTLRAVGSVAIDERRTTIVTMRSDGYVEDLFVNTTGQHVKAGEPLFRVYSSQIQQAQTDLLVAMRSLQRGVLGADADRTLDGAMQRLRNLGVPDSRIREVRETGVNPRTIDWPAPAVGTVISKRIINGQRVVAGDELYRIVDLSNIWVIADVAEGDIASIKPGLRATMTFRAYRSQPVDGVVTFIYPEVRPETRTVRVRIEVANPDEQLKPDMYADVMFHADLDKGTVATVPVSAIIDDGKQQIVLVSMGEGRFEPRPVKVGRRGDLHVEIVEGVRQGEDVVTTATFLIDAESNLQSALKTFTNPEQPK
ncbi:MAG: efflux RND transporter periplasmic adaptor subunit [Pseudolabrys sp.]|nr:efflux RND transporter periplasmic adaptor subunit [Pseudolabrys sp.]MDP2295512.1 efflux RND transporter periplasmic adaptor subunit [Pseudolabrys sp.]